MEDVVAGKLLAGRGHLLAADDADVVARRQLFRCGVRVPDQNASESGPRGVCLLTKTQNYLDRGMNYKSERHRGALNYLDRGMNYKSERHGQH